MSVYTRWLIRADMKDVMDIETLSFQHPWTEDDFVHALRRRECIGMVAEVGTKVVGFSIYELHPQRLHLVSIAVHPDCRRHGVGKAMVDKLVSKLGGYNKNRRRITTEVRETYLKAQLFFRASGFRAFKVVRNYYDNEEDAYFFRYDLKVESETSSIHS